MYTHLKKFIEKCTQTELSPTEEQLLYDAFEIKTIRKRQFLHHQGSVCKYYCYVSKGALRQYSINNEGYEQIADLGMEGAWITDIESFCMLTPSRYNIDALEDSEVLVTTQEKLAIMREASPTFVKLGIRLEEQRCIALQNRLGVTMGHTAEERFLFLQNVYPEYLKRFPQNMLASFLGLSPETVSRIRKNSQKVRS